MKRIIQLIFILSLFSCDKRNRQDGGKMEVQVDTVFIKAGDEFIFLQSGLSHSTLSTDERLLFNFTPKSELEIIDLDSLKLLDKIASDKEGPLGTGWPYAIQFDQIENLVFYGVEEVRLFNSDLSSMKRYQLTSEALSGLEPEKLSMFNLKITYGNLLFSIYENQEQVPQGIAIVSLEDSSVKKIPLGMANRILPYTYSLYVQGRLSNRNYEPINLELVNNQVIISTAYFNEVIILNLESEETTEKTFHSELTEDKKSVPIKTEAETINEISDIMKEGEKEVKFGPYYFDKMQRRFWRFSRELDREIGDSLIFRNVLTIFDEDFNQLMETEVAIDPFSKKFFKNGKLWSYVNVEDELGFAVFTIDF